jgi:hypothetical protein
VIRYEKHVRNPWIYALFFCIFLIFSLFNLLFFHKFHIFSLFNLLFFCVFFFARDYSSRDQIYHFINLTLRLFSTPTVRTRTGRGVRMFNRKLRNIRPRGTFSLEEPLDVRVYRFLNLVICPYLAILFSCYIIYFNNGFHLQCFWIGHYGGTFHIVTSGQKICE